MTKSQFQSFLFNEAKTRLEHHHAMNSSQRRKLIRAGQYIAGSENYPCCSEAAKKARRQRAQYVAALRNAREDRGVSYEDGGSSLNFKTDFFERAHRSLSKKLEAANL